MSGGREQCGTVQEGRRSGDPSGLSGHIRESYGWKKSVNRSNEQQEGEEGLSGEAQISGE